MTVNEFNEKYKDYLKEGHYGLDIHIPEVITFLNDEFQNFIKIKGFQYSQIKLKFNYCRFYFESDLPSKINSYLATAIEERIENIVKKYDKDKQQ